MKSIVGILLLTLVTVSVATELVHIDVYYESLCPDSKAFIAKQFANAYNQVPEIFNTTFVPFGNANFTKSGDTWEFHCQHGPKECLGNKLQICALNHTSVNQSTNFIICVMSVNNTVEASQECAEQSDIDWNTLDTCANSDEGSELLHDQGVETLSVSPQITWVPWIIVNGVYTKENEELAQTNFKKLVCDNYQGEKPAACN